MSSALENTTANVPAFSTAIPDGPTEDGSAGSENEVMRSDARAKVMPVIIYNLSGTEPATADPIGSDTNDWELFSWGDAGSLGTDVYGSIGDTSEVSVSGGVFTIKSGLWLIHPCLEITATIDTRYLYLNCYCSNNGSDYEYATTACTEVLNDSDTRIFNLIGHPIPFRSLNDTDYLFKMKVTGESVGGSATVRSRIVFEKKCDI